MFYGCNVLVLLSPGMVHLCRARLCRQPAFASYGKFEFGISMAPTVQNCSTSACFERVALGQLLQGLCGSRFTAVCGDSPGLTRHGSQSALAFGNDQPWTKPILRTFWKIRWLRLFGLVER